MFNKKVWYSLCTIACIGIYNTANANVFFGAGVGAVIDGVIIEGGYKLNPFISLRARGTYAPKAELSNIPTEIFTGIGVSGSSLFAGTKNSITSKAFDIGIEARPMPLIPILSSFTIIGAIQYLDMNLTMFRIIQDGRNKIPVNMVVSNKEMFAPYIGIGIDIINLPFISLRTTFGGTIRSFEITRRSYDVPPALIATVNNDITRWNKSLSKTVFIPSITLTARITL